MNYNGWQSQDLGFSQNSQITTNITLVTSVEEALFRSNVRNSDVVYFDQNRDAFYRIKVDLEGRKFWKEFTYTSKPAENVPNSFEERLRAVESKLGIGQEANNVKPDES